MTTKITDKLSKLLRLSGSSNEAEASLAMEKALQLAMEHGIEISTIDRNGDIKEEKVEESQLDGALYEKEMK